MHTKEKRQRQNKGSRKDEMEGQNGKECKRKPNKERENGLMRKARKENKI